MPLKRKSKKPSDEAKKKDKKDKVDNGPHGEEMVKQGFGPARRIKLQGGFAYQWFDSKREVVRVDFAAESSDGGWATLGFGPIHSAEQQMMMMLKLIKANGDKMLSLAASTDSKSVSIKEHIKTKTTKITKSKPADKPEEDLEKLFGEKTNPLLRRRR